MTEKVKPYDEAVKAAKDFMNSVIHYALRKGEIINNFINGHE